VTFFLSIYWLLILFASHVLLSSCLLFSRSLDSLNHFFCESPCHLFELGVFAHLLLVCVRAFPLSCDGSKLKRYYRQKILRMSFVKKTLDFT